VKTRHIVYTSKGAEITTEIRDTDLMAVALRAARETGLTVPEIAKAALVSKLRQFKETGQMTFGPGKQ
jgi:hypothetical protein